mmetsp:Transcript_38064/g.95733  ORF Transcript_38064/g.95733 Transcript_38064/m.95733 type:complete len:281 (+) Transcript_38064:1082-1924(+)
MTPASLPLSRGPHHPVPPHRVESSTSWPSHMPTHSAATAILVLELATSPPRPSRRRPHRTTNITNPPPSHHPARRSLLLLRATNSTRATSRLLYRASQPRLLRPSSRLRCFPKRWTPPSGGRSVLRSSSVWPLWSAPTPRISIVWWSVHCFRRVRWIVQHRCRSPKRRSGCCSVMWRCCVATTPCCWQSCSVVQPRRASRRRLARRALCRARARRNHALPGIQYSWLTSSYRWTGPQMRTRATSAVFPPRWRFSNVVRSTTRWWRGFGHEWALHVRSPIC